MGGCVYVVGMIEGVVRREVERRFVIKNLS